MEQAIATFVIIVAMVALGFFAFRKGKRCSCGHSDQCTGETDNCSKSTREAREG